MALAAISNHKHKQGENLVLCTDLGVRVHLNGQKRLFLTEIPLKCLAQFEQIASISATMKIPNILHCLTGWIPECISMSELTTVDEIFERLAANLDDGNIIATVTNSSTYQHLLLTGVNVLEKTLKTNSVNMATVLDTVGSKVEGEPGAYSVTWNDLVELYEEININWNPGIYECCHRCHGTVTRLNSSLYVLRIPPCEEDIEVRLFVETHFSISS